MSRTGWEAYANSEQTISAGNEGIASNVLDGNPSTIWLSRQNENSNGHDDRPNTNDPFQITINLKKKTTFRAFAFMPRSGNQNGRIQNYEFYVARTPEELFYKIHNNDYHAKGSIDTAQDKSALVAFSKPVTGAIVALRSLDHSGTAACAEFNLYDSPDPSATPLPTSTPAQSPTVSPLPTESLIFDDDHATSDTKNRIEITKDEPLGVQDDVKIYVRVSEFKDQTNDGGAIHLINYGIECDGSKFTNCKSNNGGGGGIYVKNTVDEKNPVSIMNAEMKECSAQYGGDIYAYSENRQNKVNIVNCKFANNRATATSDDQNGLFGGASVFVTCKRGKISRCTFEESDDTQSVSQVKVNSNFDTPSSASTLDSSVGFFVISDSRFESEKVSKSSLFYVRGNGNVQLKVHNCIFTGELSEGAHYIDGKIIGNNSPRMIVSSCAFESEQSGVVNSIESSNLVSMDITKQIFNYKKEMKNKNHNYNYKTVAILSLIGVAIIIAAAVKAKRNSYSSEQSESDNVKEETNFALV